MASRQDEVVARLARTSDVPAIIRLLADDPLGHLRESGDESDYALAFDALARDDNVLLVVAERSSHVVGYLQLTFIRHLSYRGAQRALIEDVRVATEHRRFGYGKLLMEWAFEQARARGCVLVQLFAHQSRIEARSFYQNLGFSDEHVGLRRSL